MNDTLQSLLDVIAAHHRERGYPPTIRELQARTGTSSPSVVAYRLRQLEDAGCIRRQPFVSRSIQIIAPAQEGAEA